MPHSFFIIYLKSYLKRMNSRVDKMFGKSRKLSLDRHLMKKDARGGKTKINGRFKCGLGSSLLRLVKDHLGSTATALRKRLSKCLRNIVNEVYQLTYLRKHCCETGANRRYMLPKSNLRLKSHA